MCLQCHNILLSDSKDYTRAYWLYKGYPPISALQYSVQTIQNRLWKIFYINVKDKGGGFLEEIQIN